MKIKKIQYSVYSPCGNNTAIIEGISYSPKERKLITSRILQAEADVEQVGFVKLSEGIQLVMAGGEFCGNATRTVAWMACQGKRGSLEIQVSGVASTIKAGVDENGLAWTEMPLLQNTTELEQINNNSSLVRMEGISHILTRESIKAVLSKTQSTNLKEASYYLLNEQGLLNSEPASGVIYVSSNRGECVITPVVYVRDIQTLFVETACGSGTVAVVVQKALQSKKSVRLPVLQPSGKYIVGSVIIECGLIKRATISGEVNYLRSGSIDW